MKIFGPVQPAYCSKGGCCKVRTVTNFARVCLVFASSVCMLMAESEMTNWPCEADFSGIFNTCVACALLVMFFWSPYLLEVNSWMESLQWFEVTAHFGPLSYCCLYPHQYCMCVKQTSDQEMWAWPVPVCVMVACYVARSPWCRFQNAWSDRSVSCHGSHQVDLCCCLVWKSLCWS